VTDLRASEKAHMRYKRTQQAYEPGAWGVGQSAIIFQANAKFFGQKPAATNKKVSIERMEKKRNSLSPSR